MQAGASYCGASYCGASACLVMVPWIMSCRFSDAVAILSTKRTPQRARPVRPSLALAHSRARDACPPARFYLG